MNKKSYKAVIFDLDGTLVDSMKDIASAVNRVLQYFNLPVQDSEFYRNRVGWGLKRTLELTLPYEYKQDLNQGLELLLQYYRERPSVETEIYQGISGLLDDLTEKGLELFVYTNKDQLTAEKIIADLFPVSTFVKVFGALEGKALKPDTQAVEWIIGKTGYKAEDILYIGDSEVDMETAAAGKMDALAVLWGFRNREQLNNYKKLGFVKRPDEIKQWIV